MMHVYVWGMTHNFFYSKSSDKHHGAPPPGFPQDNELKCRKCACFFRFQESAERAFSYSTCTVFATFGLMLMAGVWVSKWHYQDKGEGQSKITPAKIQLTTA